MEYKNFRGIRKVLMVDTYEGAGTVEDRGRIVHWIFDLDQHGGSFEGLVGKIDPAEHPENQASQKYPDEN